MVKFSSCCILNCWPDNKTFQLSSLDETKPWIRVSASAMDRKVWILALLHRWKKGGLCDLLIVLIKREGRIRHNTKIPVCQTLTNHTVVKSYHFLDQSGVNVEQHQWPTSQFYQILGAKDYVTSSFSQDTSRPLIKSSGHDHPSLQAHTAECHQHSSGNIKREKQMAKNGAPRYSVFHNLLMYYYRKYCFE